MTANISYRLGDVRLTMAGDFEVFTEDPEHLDRFEREAHCGC